MKEIRLSTESVGRIWQGELPTLDYGSLQVIERIYPASLTNRESPECAAVEVRIGPPRSFTGILGARFVPDLGTVLCVQVVTSDPNGEIVPWALAKKSDVLRAGLPDEFADGVFEGISRSVHRTRLGGGTLRFDCAAHGMIGSAPIVFGSLAEAVIYLLALGDAPANTHDLNRFFHRV